MEPSEAGFCHPYQPYSIQLDFMTQLYRCIEEKKVGIFESPTGTGKSLSLICGALTWLRDHERRLLSEIDGAPNGSDWLAQAEAALRRTELLRERDEFERKLSLIREEEQPSLSKTNGARISKKPRVSKGDKPKDRRENDDEFVLDDYHSDDEGRSPARQDGNALSHATQALLDKLQRPAEPAREESSDEHRLKIIFTSRTHSQLSQFAAELRRVTPPSSIPRDVDNAPPQPPRSERVRHLPLASRKNLCINDKVARLASNAAINERCLELQKAGTPQEKRCSYLPSKEDAAKLDRFRDKTVATVRDIEDVAHLGTSMQICPYYASRTAIPSAEIVTLPYPLLLQKAARDALGLAVKDNVVIVDEAHNLMGAIADTVSMSLRLSQLRRCVRQVSAYAARFKSRLKGKNRVYVAQVIRLLQSLVDALEGKAHNRHSSPETIVGAADLMSGKGVDQIKPHKLLQYLHHSKLCHKVESFDESQDPQLPTSELKGALMQFQNFLAVLMNPDDEGRFFVSGQEHDVLLRYTLLDPREHFRDVVESARAVVLAGGTMSPMSDYSDFLFSYLPPDRLQTFSFGHVIPPTSLFAQAIVRGPSQVQFDFTYEQRNSDVQVLELGSLLVQVCRVVPDGVVVFFPSYDYLARVSSVWGRLPAAEPVLTSLATMKPTFQESKGVSVEDMLRDYAAAVDSGRGALLLSVVGGKLSEGINFSDKLGRAVVAVGLPFPNAQGAEWKARLRHIEDLRYQQLKRDTALGEAERQAGAKAASRDFYENACMRAVNQSIGRVIRHRNDYAAILMVDRRFASERIRQKLPGWIQGSMDRADRPWHTTGHLLAEFFQKQNNIGRADEKT